MGNQEAGVFHAGDAAAAPATAERIAVVGYGNQGRAQALNLRDSGCTVVVGNRDDAYRKRARQDGFQVRRIEAAVAESTVVLMLIPDEILAGVYREQIAPNLQQDAMVVFASGYAVAFGGLEIGTQADVALLAPRMIGAGVRERYRTGEGFFCMVGVHHDASARAWERLLSLTLAVSRLTKPAIRVTFKQEAILDLFNEQAFGPAFGQVLMNATKVLLERGLPPEAVLVEMYMSEEMSYVYRTMARVGLIDQVELHSQTSQYGAITRGVRFLDPSLKHKMRRIYEEIESGAFSREWQRPPARLKLRILRFFARRQPLGAVERTVREKLGMPVHRIEEESPDEIREALEREDVQEELRGFEEFLKE
jgi:ketol-acid reductoisomerase